ncbi:OmpP1/FadL family transporter [Hymenobacter daecheongensis]|uniref:OmpP1/FadL family transporter n=1 Tax=Hymenobacter daecheongensis TaxID=496053 RepID=UPI0009348B8B|nr:outer membrane protein transport protein [Hymenobacter daecheongensis]
MLLVSFSAGAGGFQAGPQSARTLGMGGASVAYIRDLASIYYNPGALAQMDSSTRISLGGLANVRRTSFLGTDSRHLADTEFQPLPGGYFYAAKPLTDKISVGLSVNTPFGYDTRWPDSWEGRNVVQQARMNTLFVQPTAAYKINENFSVGAGLVYAVGRMSQQFALSQYDDRNVTVRYAGSGSGFGFNAGLYGKTAETLSFGISYRSPVTLNVKNGETTAANIPAADAGRYPTSARLRTEVNLPGALSVGMANQVSKKLLIAFDFTLTAWSRFDSLSYSIGEAPAMATQTVGRRYEDAMAFRVGGEYAHSRLLTLRAGVSYDETPIRDEFITPELPDGNKLGGSLGLSAHLSESLSVDAAYQFEAAALRTSRVVQANEDVSNVGGTYRTHVHTVSLGLSYSF